MSDTATTTLTADPVEVEVDHHPANIFYVRIAIILAVLTAVEVALSYSGFPVKLELGLLLFVMVIKFILVASNFMHLRFDKKVLTGLFYFGLTLAVGVYLAVLSAFELFSKHKGYR